MLDAPGHPGRSRGGQKPDSHAARVERDLRLAELDFEVAPFTIAWELTRACAYSCVHCRAEAQPRRDPRELDTAASLRLVDQLAGFGTRPILVLTGGDPLMRRDLFEIASRATERGLRVALTPTATALPTRARMARAREAGVRRLAFSLDACEPAVHDAFRGFAGSLANFGENSDSMMRIAKITKASKCSRMEMPMAKRTARFDDISVGLDIQANCIAI